MAALVALLTPLDQASARALLEEYGLELERIEPLPHLGTVNSNFRVHARGARYFLRINEGKHERDAEAEADLVAHLRARGFRTPEVLRTRGGRPCARLGEKPVTLFPWLDGREAAPDPRVPSSCALAGRLLGELHLAGGDLDAWPENHYALDELWRRRARFAGDPRFREIAPALDEELARAADRSGPAGLIHQDLFPDNVLVAQDGAWMLDLEQATRGRYVYDLAVAVNAWCWDGERFPRAAVDATVAAYESVRPLDAVEKSAFVDEARLAAARFTITRITDVALAEGVDAELARRKDWRDFARRLEVWRGA